MDVFVKIADFACPSNLEVRVYRETVERIGCPLVQFTHFSRQHAEMIGRTGLKIEGNFGESPISSIVRSCILVKIGLKCDSRVGTSCVVDVGTKGKHERSVAGIIQIGAEGCKGRLKAIVYLRIRVNDSVGCHLSDFENQESEKDEEHWD